jgi:hypothetical protein
MHVPPMPGSKCAVPCVDYVDCGVSEFLARLKLCKCLYYILNSKVTHFLLHEVHYVLYILWGCAWGRGGNIAGRGEEMCEKDVNVCILHILHDVRCEDLEAWFHM